MSTLILAISILASAAGFAADDRPKRLLVFGDSLCAGSNIADGTAADAWPVLACAADGIAIVNRSKGGRPTDSIGDFTQALADVGHIDGILLALGTNDSRDPDPGMVARAVEHIGAMVETAHRQGIRRIVIAGPLNINPDALAQSVGMREQRVANLRKLNTAYEAFASSHGCIFISLYGLAPLRSMEKDGVHCNKAGNQAIAQAMAGKLAAALATTLGTGH